MSSVVSPLAIIWVTGSCVLSRCDMSLISFMPVIYPMRLLNMSKAEDILKLMLPAIQRKIVISRVSGVTSLLSGIAEVKLKYVAAI